MHIYTALRDWVDRQWNADGLQWKILLLPAVLPMLVIVVLLGGPGTNPVSWFFGWGWFGLWNGFVVWRFCIYLKAESRRADARFDQKGKFRLSKDYHDTESATAVAKRRNQEKQS